MALKLQKDYEMRQEMQKEVEKELESLKRKIEVQNQLLEMSQRNLNTDQKLALESSASQNQSKFLEDDSRQQILNSSRELTFQLQELEKSKQQLMAEQKETQRMVQMKTRFAKDKLKLNLKLNSNRGTAELDKQKQNTESLLDSHSDCMHPHG